MPAERKARTKRAGVKWVVASAVVLASSIAALATQRWGVPELDQLLFFWLLHSLTLLDRVEVPVERLSLLREEAPRGVVLSPGFIVLLTAAFATSPSTAIAVALVPALPAVLGREGRDALRILFNSAQEAVYVGAAAALFATIRSAGPDVLSSFVAAAGAALVALVLNTVFVAVVVAVDRGISLGEILRRMTWTAPHSIGFGLIALMIATVYGEHGPVAAVFLFMPLAALRVARRAKLQLDGAREKTILDFVHAVEAKDPYTFRHSERVAAIVVELHRELGASSAQLERRWTAAVLHDVGKVAVPADILAKPGSLTAAEFDAIKIHSEVGAAAVQEIDLFQDLTAEILHHHERLDGRGYPSGLVGDAIPYEARVLAVADAFEALTSDRPYRAALTPEEAESELARTAGSHHDPDVVRALERVLQKGMSFLRSSDARRVQQAPERRAVGDS